MVTIVAMSDTHRLHEQISIPEGDILVHAGDFTNWGIPADVVAFNHFLGKLSHKYKIVVAGNHDFCFEHEPQAARRLFTNCIYLQDEAVTVEGIKFYGSPWQPAFCNWAFNLPRGYKLRAKWDLIPEDTDILITHGPPMGHGDTTINEKNTGCADLLHRVKQIHPKYHIFGHIHEAAGITHNEYTTFINASCLDFHYALANAPIVFTWNGK
jgi:Icc-related predicted phosphoesterase